MKQGWEIKKLGEVCSITMGQSPSSDTYNNSVGLPFFQGNADFGKVHPSVRVYCNAPIRIANVDDILISVRAPIGAINIANCKCCIGRGLASIRNNAEVANEYIYHALVANKEKLIAQGTGSTFKSIGREALKDLQIPIPPIEVQERIVAELDCLSSVIEKKREQLKELDALAQSIFYQMFGDPITNEKGWEVKKLEEVAPQQEYKGSVPCVNGKYWLLNLDMVKSHTGDIIDKCYYDKKEIGTSTIVFNSANVLYSKLRPYLNKVVIPNDIGYATSELVPLCPIKGVLNRVFFASLLRSSNFVKYISSKVAGAKMPRVSMGTFREFSVILPPFVLQQEFAEKIEAIEKQKELIKKSISEVEDLFNSRMAYYFN